MLKEIIPVFPVISAAQMSNSLTSNPTLILHKDNISYEASWTGSPTGTFSVEGSQSYSAGTPQGGGAITGPANAGIWTPLLFPAGTMSVAGTTGSKLIRVDQAAFPWIRLGFTSTALLVQTIALVADVAGSLNSTYFLLNSGNNASLFYVWFDDGGGVDPLIAGRTGVPITYTDDDSAATIGATMAAAIAALGGAALFSTSGTSTVTVTNLVAGPTAQAVDGAAPTGFTFALTTGSGLLTATVSGKSIG